MDYISTGFLSLADLSGSGLKPPLPPIPSTSPNPADTKILVVDTTYISINPLTVGPASPNVRPAPLTSVYTIGLSNLGTASLTVQPFVTYYVAFDTYPIYKIDGNYYGPSPNSYWTGNPDALPSIVIAAGQTVYYEVYWYSTTMYPYNNAITYVSDSDFNPTQCTYIDLNVTNNYSSLQIIPLRYNYTMAVGNTSAAQTVTLRNTGNKTVNVSDIIIDDPALVTPIPDYTGLGGTPVTSITGYSNKTFTLA